MRTIRNLRTMRRNVFWILGVVTVFAVFAGGLYFLRAPRPVHANSLGVTVAATTIPNPFGGQSTSVSAINSAGTLGQVVGTADDSSGNWHAFYWQIGSPTPPQDITPPGAIWASPADMNNSGQIIGYTNTSVIEWQVLTPSVTTTPVVLPTGISSGYVHAINDSGQVVGTITDANGVSTGVAWMNGIGVPPTFLHPPGSHWLRRL